MKTRINLHPEQPHIIANGDELGYLVASYLKETRQHAVDATARSYDYALGLFLEWWGEHDSDLGYRLDPNAWQHYEKWLRSRRSEQSGDPLTLNTRQKALATVKQLLIWGYRGGYFDRNFADQVPAARGEPRRRPALGVDDLIALMAAAGETKTPIRDQAMLAVFIGTGIRRAELAGLNVEDVSWNGDGAGGQIFIRKGKFGKARYVVFDDTCGAYLAPLIEELDRNRGPLFVGWKDRRLGVKQVYAVVKAAMQRAGLDNRGAGPHDLRRAFATAWLMTRRSLGDGQLLSMQLGHTSAQMTVHYSRPTLDDLRVGFASPLTYLHS